MKVRTAGCFSVNVPAEQHGEETGIVDNQMSNLLLFLWELSCHLSLRLKNKMAASATAGSQILLPLKMSAKAAVNALRRSSRPTRSSHLSMPSHS